MEGSHGCRSGRYVPRGSTTSCSPPGWPLFGDYDTLGTVDNQPISHPPDVL
ncbi:MAG TPA: hypothetical protein VGW74_16735 [Propionibacteriaceae bacterium]|nr:hypothetical protein [Propionibacteriaceae bacterium]